MSDDPLTDSLFALVCCLFCCGLCTNPPPSEETQGAPKPVTPMKKVTFKTPEENTTNQYKYYNPSHHAKDKA
jgi:hypothetical protein